MEDSSSLSGRRISHYHVLEQLGAGGMGEVYRAHDDQLDRDVALKSLPAGTLTDESGRKQFRKEALALAKLNHPNIETVHEFGTEDGVDFLAMELIAGSSLRQKIKEGPLQESETVRLSMQLAEGLAAAHEQGVIHRDLKPANVMVTSNGRLKVLDFGLAKLIHHDLATDTTRSVTVESGTISGTVPYMAPEQLRGLDVDARADIYGAGAVIYEMATGRRPFPQLQSAELMGAILHQSPASPSSINPRITPGLESVILKALQKEPSQRYQSARELLAALEGISFSVAATSADTSAAVRVVAAAEPSNAPLASSPAIRRGWPMIAFGGVVLVVLAAGTYFHFHRAPVLTEKDTIVLSDFTNTTGDAIFDDTLKTALNVSLRQSPFLNVLSDSEVRSTLQLMARPADTKLTPGVTREICQRAGSKAYLAGSIGSLGSEFVVGLRAVNCQSGDTLVETQVTAASKEKVLDALDEGAAKLRGELGESLATVDKFDVPLAQATTSSLEALKAFSLGQEAANEKGPAAAFPYLQRSIQLDPIFASAYWTMGNDYATLGETSRAGEYYAKAFELREHASEQESLAIAAEYYSSVTGELDKAAKTYRERIAAYPRNANSLAGLGNAYTGLGEYGKAIDEYREAVRLDPDSVSLYGNLVNCLLALKRFDEARLIIQQAHARKIDDIVLHNALYALAFIAGNSTAMADERRWFNGKPEEDFALSLESDTQAYAGHLTKARELTTQATDSAVRNDSKENAAIWRGNAAIREAAFGNVAAAKQAASDGLKSYPNSKGVQVETALALALVGEISRADSMAQKLNKSYPLDTQIQSLWLPTIRAQLSLDGKNSSAALQGFPPASPVELGQIPFVANISCLYPTYIRGEANLVARQGAAAAAEFQKILDHRGIVWNCWTGALAHLGVARANTLQAKTSQGADADAARVHALAAYKDFLTLWKDADPDIPILKEAKAEYAKLQ
jgi:serine/threonine protein kinase/tetratricopeptide (TPR) repeat protein